MRNSRGIGRGYYLPYNAPVRRHVPLTSDPNFITTLLASGQNPPSITRPDQFVLDDRVSLSPRDFARRYEPLEELHVGIHCHSFNEVFFQDSYHNKTNKKYPPNQKFVDEGTGKEQVHLSHHQAMLLYDNTLHQKNPFYDRQSFCNYPPDNNSAAALFANPRVIRPTFPPNLSPLHVQIFPNRSTQTYDKHVHDYPIGCETDLTLVFYPNTTTHCNNVNNPRHSIYWTTQERRIHQGKCHRHVHEDSHLLQWKKSTLKRRDFHSTCRRRHHTIPSMRFHHLSFIATSSSERMRHAA